MSLSHPRSQGKPPRDPAARRPGPANVPAPAPHTAANAQLDAAPGRRRGWQWYLGTVLFGWGLAVLVGIVPHEDLLVGAGLATFGAALALSSRSVPEVGPLPAWVPLLLGSAMAAGAAWFLLQGFAAAKVAILVLGVALAATAGAQRRRVRWPGHPEGVPVSTLAASLLPMAMGPAAVYAAQGLFAQATGMTPLETFLKVGLIAPMAAVLALLGWSPSQEGIVLTYVTPAGPMDLEVGVACSGIQAMAMFAGVLALLLVAERPPPKTAALLCIVGLVGVYLANVIRLVGLAVVGYHWGPDALEQAHAQAGWTLFVAWALLFAFWARRKLPQGPPRARAS